MDSLKPEDRLTHTCKIFDYNKWHEQAQAWSLSSNFSVANHSMQKQFFRSIVNNVVMNVLKPKITNTTTFAQMLKLAKEYFDNTTSRFNCIQQWLNLKQDKDEPVSSYMERLTELAKKIEIKSLRRSGLSTDYTRL